MKALRVILWIIGVLVAGYLVLCIVGPKQMDASASMEMDAPPAVVYQQIGNLENWVNWGPWQNADSTMEVTYGEKTEGQGASYSWTSENMGDGNLEVMEANPPASMKTRLKFSNWDGYSYGHWNIEETEAGSSNVTWSMTSDPTPFLFRGMMSLMGMDKAVEKDFTKGLTSLKDIAEQEAANMPATYNGFEISMVDFPASAYAGIREEVSMDAMEEFFGRAYGEIMAAMQSNEVQMAGPPSALYYTWDEATMTSDLVAAIPIAEATNLGENISVVELPAGKAALIDYYGGYDNIGAAHEAMDAYMKEKGLTFKAPAIEVYVSDPGTEPDTSKWLTKVMYLYE